MKVGNLFTSFLRFGSLNKTKWCFAEFHIQTRMVYLKNLQLILCASFKLGCGHCSTKVKFSHLLNSSSLRLLPDPWRRLYGHQTTSSGGCTSISFDISDSPALIWNFLLCNHCLYKHGPKVNHPDDASSASTVFVCEIRRFVYHFLNHCQLFPCGFTCRWSKRN